MAKRFVSYEERVEFFELLCSGLSMEAAAAGGGVSTTAGRGWWRASGRAELVLQMGATGRAVNYMVGGLSHWRERSVSSSRT
jgi:hypothetical protein